MTSKYDEYTKSEIKKFVDEMIKDYEKSNIINSFCTIEDFKNEQIEFIQVGEKVNLPKEFFTRVEGVHQVITPIANDFVRSLIHGEKDFILNEIINSKNVSEPIKIPSFDLKELSMAVSNFKNPTDIFFPIEKFHKKVYSFVYENSSYARLIFENEPLLEINGMKIKVHWILSRQEINKIIVINKRELKVIQKKFEQAEKIKNIKPIREFENFSKNQKLMLYFSEKDEENFSFIFRTVISKPKLNENSALVIEVEE